jgi:hypothetical protein
MKLGEVLFCLAHPIAATGAKLRQKGVSLDWEGPPAGATIEDFPDLSIQEAAALIAASRQGEGGGGVQL